MPYREISGVGNMPNELSFFGVAVGLLSSDERRVRSADIYKVLGTSVMISQ